MSISLLLIPLALVLLAASVGAFFWAVDNDQFEDLDSVGTAALDLDPPVAEPPQAGHD
jgi:cbb3-type cytochrome oxidase maturation protein